MGKALDIDEFKRRAIAIHGDKYDYNKSRYVDYSTPLDIYCKVCGKYFPQTPLNHLRGRGCPNCRYTRASSKTKLSKEDFIERANKRHNGKYDYFKADYVDRRTEMCIVCPIHGDTWQKPVNHLRNSGCPYCNKTSRKDFNYFIERATSIHNGKYSYSKTIYKNSKTPVVITCPIHGDFNLRPNDHLQGVGCKDCGTLSAAIKHRYTKEEFEEKANALHHNKYSYEHFNYTDEGKVIITCSIHGDFTQSPSSHLQGKGCKKCNSSKLESGLRHFLEKRYKGIVMEQYSPSWLTPQSLDFYLPRLNIAIECQGIQHFEANGLYGRKFKQNIERDERKRKLCEENGVRLLYYSNLGIEYPYQVYEDKEELLKEILKQRRKHSHYWH